ncbi:dUTPase, dimeric [Campylobacter blaseri]|uniref:dUTPase n=1 Tax=Campylobacter blaseri TaxID=2042961 RepID=A0A2P8R184_9BACT|nr:dUTP diphosphatase [Campylobacter blaseri]PSM52254.1 dUTPase [Campylobacter blaseri]PSM54020.1 dUTPase [Campylobacter blaseri]QKF85458.1 dUTPase, dimeric [Campylobacter blaseri]
MEYKKILKEMFVMQQHLNNETNGLKWEEGYTNKGKLISWKRCIYMECAELIDSFAWKHWKNIEEPTNEENVAVEIVDIWHFIMSYVLEQAYPHKDIDCVVEDVASVSGFGDFCIDPYDMSEYSIYEIINDVEIIIHDTSGFNFEIHNLLTNYFRLSLKCGVNLHKLFEIYIGKNVLNKFRQDNGYKDGSYKKVWNGKEDNVVMSEILKTGILKADDIYQKLEENYKSLK